MKQLIIAIDGPAASGKSTTARLVARKLGYMYVDTGAMYRAVTVKVLRHRADPSDGAAVAQLARTTNVRLEVHRDLTKVFLDNEDVTEEIRLPEVTRAVSAVSSVQEVRDLMVREQRAMGATGGIVVEGRDIGTVVFPNADIKIFMTASPHERASRRVKELEMSGQHVGVDALEREILERDRKDSSRAISPLMKADGAIDLDTTNLTIEELVDFIVAKAKERAKG